MRYERLNCKNIKIFLNNHYLIENVVQKAFKILKILEEYRIRQSGCDSTAYLDLLSWRKEKHYNDWFFHGSCVNSMCNVGQ